MDHHKDIEEFRIFQVFTGRLLQELHKAEAKHPWKEKTMENICVQANILTEESGEVAGEANKLFAEGKDDWSNMETELIQTACVAFRIFKNLKATELLQA